MNSSKREKRDRGRKKWKKKQDRIVHCLGVSASAWTAMIVVVWILWFVMRVYINYESLSLTYETAEKTVRLGNNPSSGREYRDLHHTEYEESRRLLSQSKLYTAFLQTWHTTYLCGTRTCFKTFFGNFDTWDLLVYMLLLGIVSFMISQMSVIVRSAGYIAGPMLSSLFANRNKDSENHLQAEEEDEDEEEEDEHVEEQEDSYKKSNSYKSGKTTRWSTIQS